MATTSAPPFPSNGLRTLSPAESLRRMKAAACQPPKIAMSQCSGQVHVGFFFDGTGNNLKRDFQDLPPQERKHSNVVKLYQAYRDDARRGYFRLYMPGVGTPFPEIGDPGDARGKAFAYKGEDRIVWALLQLVNIPHRYATGGAYLLNDARAANITSNLASSGSPAAQRRTALQSWQQQLASALQGRKPVVEQINLSVFGFSRGAAEARAFVNWLFEVCERKGADWLFGGIPLRVQFMGIFDTVASVGLSNLLNTGTFVGHQSWADGDLRIHPAVEQCVHFVAGHEVRACFPLDSVRLDKRYPSNAAEVMFPGAHSDVGGGYAPGALGTVNGEGQSLAIIPGARMYHIARQAGVPLLSWNDLPSFVQNALTPDETLVKAFNEYVQDSGAAAAPVEQLHRRHMKPYFSYRFKHRGDFTARAPFARAQTSERAALLRTQQSIMDRLRALGMGDPLQDDFDPHQALMLGEQMNKAAGLPGHFSDSATREWVNGLDARSVTPAMERLFENYVHDSMAGFILDSMDEYKFNHIGLAKFRSIYKGGDAE